MRFPGSLATTAATKSRRRSACASAVADTSTPWYTSRPPFRRFWAIDGKHLDIQNQSPIGASRNVTTVAFWLASCTSCPSSPQSLFVLARLEPLPESDASTPSPPHPRCL